MSFIVPTWVVEQQACPRTKTYDLGDFLRLRLRPRLNGLASEPRPLRASVFDRVVVSCCRHDVR